MQKVIQTELFNEFTVTASVPAAGSYDLTRASKRDPDEPAFTFVFIAYIIKAYDEVYGLNILADAIRPEYLDVVNTHFDGTRSGAQISALLPPTDSPADSFFNRAFLQKFNNGELPALSNRIAENNLHDWIPTAATRFFQAREDKIVAFEPVVQMVQTMRGNGATDIELIECYAGRLATTHDNCFFPALIYSAGFFSTLARDL